MSEFPPVLVGERVLWLGSGSGIPKGGIVKWIGRLPEMGPNWAVGLQLQNRPSASLLISLECGDMINGKLDIGFVKEIVFLAFRFRVNRWPCSEKQYSINSVGIICCKDEALPYGGIDGTWRSRSLFSCKPKHGLIVPSTNVIREPQLPVTAENSKGTKEITSENCSALSHGISSNRRVRVRDLSDETNLLKTVHGGSEGRRSKLSRRLSRPERGSTEVGHSSQERSSYSWMIEHQRQNDRLVFKRMNFRKNAFNGSFDESLSFEGGESVSSSKSSGSRRDRSSRLFSLLKWFRKDKVSYDIETPSIPGSPVFHRPRSITGSVDTLFSTATANSFAFVHPLHYRPFGLAAEPEILIAEAPETNTYRNRIRERDRLRRSERNISLQEKYRLYASGTLPRSVDHIHEISDLRITELSPDSKNSTFGRKKKKAPPPPARNSSTSENSLPAVLGDQPLEEVCKQHRRALSEPVKYVKGSHVKGKRKAPQPPAVLSDSDVASVATSAASSIKRSRKKRRAPSPPFRNTSKTENKENNIFNLIQEATSDILNEAWGDTSRDTQDTDLDTSNDTQIIATDTLKLEKGILKPNKMDKSVSENTVFPTSPVSPRPWYKRTSANRESLKERERRKDKERRKVEDWMLESGFPRRSILNMDNCNNLVKLDKSEDKRRSQISILTNISELDREAAELIKQSKVREQNLIQSHNAKYYTNNEIENRSDIDNTREQESPRRSSAKDLISLFNAITNVTKVTVNSSLFSRDSNIFRRGSDSKKVIPVSRIVPTDANNGAPQTIQSNLVELERKDEVIQRRYSNPMIVEVEEVKPSTSSASVGSESSNGEEKPIAKVTIEELDEYDAERFSKAQALYEANRQNRHLSPPVIPTIAEASENSLKSSPTSTITSNISDIPSDTNISPARPLTVWVCPRCTLENLRWRITCEACDIWRPTPCELKEKSSKSTINSDNKMNTEDVEEKEVPNDKSNNRLYPKISDLPNLSEININALLPTTENYEKLKTEEPQSDEMRKARLEYFDKNRLSGSSVNSLEDTTKFHHINEDNVDSNKLKNIKEDNVGSNILQNIKKDYVDPNKLQNLKVNNNGSNILQNIKEDYVDPNKLQNIKEDNAGSNFLQNIKIDNAHATKLQNLTEDNAGSNKLQNIKEDNADSKKLQNIKEDKVDPTILENSKKNNCGKKENVCETQDAELKQNSKMNSLASADDKQKLKELLIEMKHSLPKRPKAIKNSENKHANEEKIKTDLSNVIVSGENSKSKSNNDNIIGTRCDKSPDRAEAYLVESMTTVEEIKIKKPIEKVSSSAQTSGLIRQLHPKVKAAVGKEIIVPIRVEDHVIKDGILYTSVSNDRKRIGTGTFELMRPRDFASIEAIKKGSDNIPLHLYANIADETSKNASHTIEGNISDNIVDNKPTDVDILSKQLTIPQGLANFKAGLGGKSEKNMDTLAVNKLLKRLEGAIAEGRHELAAALARELAEQKVSCSMKRQKAGGTSSEILVEMYVEDQHSHRGPFPIKVKPSMTVEELKQKIEREYEIPSGVQRWILGKELASNDSAIIGNLGVNNDGTPIFLYLVAPDLDQVKDLEGQLEGVPSTSGITSLTAVICESGVDPRKQQKTSLDPGPSTSRANTEEIIHIQEILNPNGTLSLGWKCGVCTLLNSPTRPGCAACTTPRPENYHVPKDYQVSENEIQRIENEVKNEKEIAQAIEEENVQSYQELVDLEKDNLILSMAGFECPVCFTEFPPMEGVVLRECLHVFCRDCLAHTIEYSEEAEVKCPFRDDNYTCNSTLLEREIKMLVSREIFEEHLAKSIALAETKIVNAFHCKTPDCKGWCIYEDNVNIFPCPVCTHTNCLTCQAIHEGLNCKQFQERLRDNSDTNNDTKRTKEMLQEMVDRGEAMNCPTCQVVLMKKWGCDWLRCSMCKTEICWVTRGPRWGPNGKGDTNGGCQCGVNGIKCHPRCTYCH